MLVVAVILALAAAYAARRALAREALVGWLEARGVPASVEFRDFDLGAFAARLRLGPERDADVTAELAEVRYGFTGFWSGEPFGVRITSVVLHRPVIKASLKGGKLSLGSLDPVIEELTRRPPRPDVRQPEIRVREGVLRLATDYGPVQARLNAELADGRLMALEGKVGATALRGRGLSLLTGPGEVKLVTTRDRLDLTLNLPVRRVEAKGLSASDAELKASLRAPYPDLDRRRADGEVSARIDLAGRRIVSGGTALQTPRLEVVFGGRLSGALQTLVLRGDAETRLIAKAAEAPGAKARNLDLNLHAHEIKWTRSGGEAVSANLFAEARAAAIDSGETRLSRAVAKFQGPGRLAAGVVGMELEGGLTADGAWTGLGAPRADDPAQTAALKKAFRGFQLEAGQVSLRIKGQDVAVALGAPATMTTNTGGRAILAAHGGPLYAAGQGAFRLNVGGGGLPKAELLVPRYRLTPTGLVATTGLRASGDFGPVEAGTLDTAGELRVAGGATSFVASRCTAVTARRLELGENDIEAIDGKVCPTGAPLLTLAKSGWRLRGQAQGLSARAPFLEARLSEAASDLDFRGVGEALTGRALITAARIDDTAVETRFQPVRATGEASTADGGWTGGFIVTDLARRRLGQAQLRYAADGHGGLDFDTGLLAFEEGGLQPVNLSPMATMVASPATGRARFQGQIAWTPETSSSHGTLSVERMDFVSPLGPLSGLTGQVAFNSLIPLTAAPGQSLKAESVATLVPLTDVEARFGLQGEALTVEGAKLAVGGGTLIFEPFTLPFKPGATWTGVVNFKGVQVSDLIEASPFGDRVDLDARLSGRVPFEVTPEGVRVSNGKLAAVQPGRVSIRREALIPVAQEGGAATVEAPGAPPGAAEGMADALNAATAPGQVNAFSEFAYQAMEHLAFDSLDAEVNSLPNGRLGVLLHVKGEHTPPKKQVIRLSIIDLITRRFLNKALPLPSGTKVDLTLDTSLNLDQLLKDFADYQSLRGSQAVQP
ncbi:intermembrane phospholipid transport protein YdbH family protein [Phenylobacterium sp.]|uniref:intermembrane phospholipid transport protein YdbH family protein n=1 Tax=Phenylobacterium sp. TaxID=1871053 RepID=UPI002FCA6E34